MTELVPSFNLAILVYLGLRCLMLLTIRKKKLGMVDLREIIRSVYPNISSKEVRSLTSNLSRFISKEKIPFEKRGNKRFFDSEATKRIKTKLKTIAIGEKSENDTLLKGKIIVLSQLINDNFQVETKKQRNSLRSIANNFIHDNDIPYQIMGRNTVVSEDDAKKIIKRLKEVQQLPAYSKTVLKKTKDKVPTYSELLDIINKKDKQIDKLIEIQQEFLNKLFKMIRL